MDNRLCLATEGTADQKIIWLLQDSKPGNFDSFEHFNLYGRVGLNHSLSKLR